MANPETPAEWIAHYKSIRNVEGCALCEKEDYPVPHKNSPYCESGKRPHCTCDMCF